VEVFQTNKDHIDPSRIVSEQRVLYTVSILKFIFCTICNFNFDLIILQ